MSFKKKAIEISENYIGKGVFVFGSIPGKKLENATISFPIDTDDEIISLIDATVFGSCKVGMAFGLKGVYWRNDRNEGKTFLTWDELVNLKDKIYTKMFSELFLGPGNVMTLSGADIKTDQAKNLVIQLIDAYEKSDVGSQESKSVNLPSYIIAILKISAIYATDKEDVCEEIVGKCLEYINYDEGVVDKEYAITVFQEYIHELSNLKGVFRKLEISKIQAELNKYTYSDSEKNIVKIMMDDLKTSEDTFLTLKE